MTEHAISPDQLPEPIPTYLAAHRVHDADTAVPCFAEDALVVDDGSSHHGPEQIREWLQRAASEYTYTTRLTGAARLGDDRYVATHHLEGDFPGGVVDLRFRFDLRDGRIARLAIGP